MTETLSSYAELVALIEHLPMLCREKRRREGLSVRAAAKLLGFSFSTLSRFENGKDGNMATLVAVLRWVGEVTP